MATSPTLRRIAYGLPTVLGLRKKGYFIPYRYAGGIPRGAERAAFPFVDDLFRAHEDAFLSLLTPTETIADLARRFDRGAWPYPKAPRWQQVWFPRLDALAVYLLIAKHRPARIVEVGSGHSTRFAAESIADHGLATTICAIDPDPRTSIAELPPVTVHRMTLQDVPLDLFAGLAPGDMLMIDSSHIAMPGSDVDLLLGRIVPALPTGVLIQIHDMFLPDPYPESWAWRGYNEQLPVATLLAGGGYVPVWSSHWVATRRADALSGTPVAEIPIDDGAPESALWLLKTGTAA